MTTEIKLKECILSKYKSIREFCLQNDFPYSTIDNMFKRERGIMGTSVSIVIKVCNCLNIDINELENGNIIEKAPAVIELSKHEKKLIIAYRNKPDMQAAVAAILGIDDKKSPSRTGEVKSNIIRIAGRDGSYEEREPTDEELNKLKSEIMELPDAPDDI